MRYERKVIKVLIKIAPTTEEADEILENCAGLKTIKEKIAFLRGMFDCKNIYEQKTDSDEEIYQLALQSIIDKKWRSSS